MKPTTFREDPKQAAIDAWTADPCGIIDGEPGTRDYFERLLRSRDEYVYAGYNGQWMVELLDYAGAKDLRVLDVGSGQGTDLYRHAAAGAIVTAAFTRLQALAPNEPRAATPTHPANEDRTEDPPASACPDPGPAAPPPEPTRHQHLESRLDPALTRPAARERRRGAHSRRYCKPRSPAPTAGSRPGGGGPFAGLRR